MNTSLTTRIGSLFASALITLGAVHLIAGYALPESPTQAATLATAPQTTPAA